MDAASLPTPAGFDLADPEFAELLLREKNAERRRDLLADALLRFFVRAGSLDQGAHIETPAALESLIAVELNAVLEARLGVELGLTELRRAVSARQLAKAVVDLLDGASVPSAGDVLVPDDEGRFELFGLTDLQQAYLLGRGGFFALGNVPAAFYAEIDAVSVDVERLESAWNAVVARHDMLRTVFTDDGRQQAMADVPTYRFPRHDVRDVGNSEREARLAGLREEIAGRVREPAQWPLFEIAVTRLDEEHARVHMAVDLLIADAPGIRQLLGEWLTLDAGRDPGPAPRVTFRDHVRALEGVEESAAFARAREYWLDRLPDLPSAPELPLRVAPEAVEAVRFSARSLELSPERWTRLRQRALRNGLTPSMVLCWAYAATLRTWSAGDAFTLNVTVNERLPIHPDIDRVIGEFTSQVLVAFETDEQSTVRDRITALQDRFWEDFEHRAFSGVRVLRELARSQDGTRTTMPFVFDAVLGRDFDQADLPAWFQGMPYVSATTPQVALECQVFEWGGALRVNWAVVEELFPPGLIDAAFTAFGGLLERLADDENQWNTTELALVGPTELTARQKANATETPLPETPLHELGGPLRARGDTPAVITTDRTLSYAELDRRATRIARHLRELGATPNTLIAIVMDKGWQQPVAALAILQSAAAYLPIDATWPEQRIHHILAKGQCHLVLTQTHQRDTLNWPDNTTVLAVDDDTTWANIDDTPIQTLTHPQDLAYVIFTSGSTGEPKGVMIDHRGAANTITDINNRFAITTTDRVLGLSSLSFDLSVWDIFGILAAGGTLILPPPDTHRDPATWTQLIQQHRITLWNTVPALMEMLVEHTTTHTQPLQDLRLIMLSGDWTPLTLPDRIHSTAPNAHTISLGGATEASIWSICHPIHTLDPTWPSIPYGRPLANQTFHILDTHLNPVPTWVPGELFIGGTGLAHGYWDDPQKTTEHFLTHPHTGERLYRTGDIGRYHPDATIEFLGRNDHQVKINGYRIELGEIETKLTTHPTIKDAIVTATNNHLTAYLTTTQPTTDNPHQLITDIRTTLTTTLPHYMIPHNFILLENLPLSPNGKIDRGQLPAPDLDDIGDGAEDGTAPRNLREERLSAVWCGVLGRQSIGIHTAFFSAGGDSLLAVRTAVAAASNGLPLTAADVFAHPTIAAQAALLAARDHAPAGQESALPRLVSDPDARFELFGLTDLQQAYLLGRGGFFALGNAPAAFYAEIDAASVDVERLESAWNAVVARHDMLRTVFTDDGRQQAMADVPTYRFARFDVRGLGAEARETYLTSIREEIAGRVREPAQWPLFEIAVTRLDEEHARVHIAIDLLITDGSTLGRIVHEWGAFHREPGADITVPGVSFRDYVRALEGVEESAAFARAREYWLDRLPDLPSAPELPLRVAPEALEAVRFSARSLELSPERWTRLRQRALRNGLTPSMVLCWAYAATLRTWSAGDTFTLNVTVNERLPIHPDIDRVIGEFTAVILLAAEFDATAPVRDQARVLQDRFWKDFDHRAFNGVQVLRELARTDGAARATMPVVFTSALGDGEASLGRAAEEFGELAYTITQTPQVFLECQVFEWGGALRVNWAVVEELFPPGLIDAAFTAFGGLLERLADDENQWNTTELALVGPTELTARQKANATETPLPETPLHELGGPLRARGDTPAVITTDRTLSYAELDRRATRIARHLRELGATPNTLIAIVMDKGWQQPVAALAILQSAAAYLPIDATWPEQRIHHILAKGQCHLVLTQTHQRDTLNWPDNTTVLAVDDDTTWANIDDTPIQTLTHPQDLAYVIFTSGSTGEPKGVMIDHRGAANTITDINNRFAITTTDRVLGLSSLSFDLSVWDIFGILAAGGTLILPPPDTHRDPATWTQLIQQHRITLWNTVPALMEMLVEHTTTHTQPLQDLRLIMLSGDWTPLTLPDRIHSTAPNAHTISLGGATEASIWSICHPIHTLDPTWPSIPYGRPLANQTFHILDTHLNPVPTWVPGELFIGGTGLAHGYWDDPQKTTEHFLTHPHTGERLYRTGDIGRYHPDATIEFLGRNDHQVKINGYRIELGEIETKLTTHPTIKDAIVTATNNHLTAYLTTTQPTTDNPHQLITDIRTTLTTTLPHYMIPHNFILLENLPLSPNGKIDRGALPAPLPQAREHALARYPGPGHRPRTGTAQRHGAAAAGRLDRGARRRNRRHPRRLRRTRRRLAARPSRDQQGGRSRTGAHRAAVLRAPHHRPDGRRRHTGDASPRRRIAGRGHR